MKLVWCVVALVLVIFVFLVPLIPESIQTQTAQCADQHGCITGPRPLPVTASVGFRLFSLGVVTADIPCESGVVGMTYSYVSFGSACGQVAAWLW